MKTVIMLRQQNYLYLMFVPFVGWTIFETTWLIWKGATDPIVDKFLKKTHEKCIECKQAKQDGNKEKRKQKPIPMLVKRFALCQPLPLPRPESANRKSSPNSDPNVMTAISHLFYLSSRLFTCWTGRRRAYTFPRHSKQLLTLINFHLFIASFETQNVYWW